jgi:hypothetical protein
MTEAQKPEVQKADPKPATPKPVARPKRTPLGVRNRITFTKQDPNFVYRLVNDDGERISQAIEAGYAFVESDDKLGDERAGEGGAIDTRVSKPVGNGKRGFLMRIPREYYNEDQALKNRLVDESELALKPKTKKGEYGEGLTNS